MIGILEHNRNSGGGGSSQAYLLDSYPQAAFAHSMCRRLLSSYTGPLFEAVVNGDNYREIYASTDGMVDETALQEHLSLSSDGSMFAFVYDQVTGAVSNLGNFTLASGGSLHRAANGKIARSAGAAKFPMTLSAGEISLFSAAQFNNPTNLANSIFDCSNNQSFGSSNGVRFDNVNGTFRFGINGTFLTTPQTVANTPIIHSAIKTLSGRKIYVNGILKNSDSQSGAINYTNITQYKLLATTNGTDQNGYNLLLNGYFQEIIGFESDMSAHEQALNSDLVNFYTI